MFKKDTGSYGPSRLVNVAVVLCLLSVSCSDERVPVNEKPVVPVTGVVIVDGSPAEGIKIKFHAKTQESSHRVFPKAKTDADGRFRAWTYRIDDGLPPGEYSITFIEHGQLAPMQRESSAPDLFGGKYSDPNNTEHTITVEESDEPIDMGTIELTR